MALSQQIMATQAQWQKMTNPTIRTVEITAVQ